MCCGVVGRIWRGSEGGCLLRLGEAVTRQKKPVEGGHRGETQGAFISLKINRLNCEYEAFKRRQAQQTAWHLFPHADRY